jgi:lantibiotic leader peptide-processing serine protease
MKAGILAAALLAALASTHAAAQTAPAGRYLVVFKSEAVPADAAQRIVKNGGRINRTFGPIGVVAVSGDAAFAARMGKDAKVLAVGLEGVFGLPDATGREMTEAELAVEEGAPTAADNLYAAYQWDMRRMNAPAVWSRLPLSANTPRVAVLDTGVMDSHPDLAGQLDASVSTTYCNTAGGPNNTAAYPIYSTLIDYDAYPNWAAGDPCTPAANTYESHGTHVAGTIAAKFGGGRVVGVAPDAKVGAFKVFDRYRYTGANGVVNAIGAFDGPLFSAILQASNAGYPVISMSLGSHVFHNDKDGNASILAWDRVLKLANRNGTVVVASAGNSAYDLNGTLVHVPGDLASVVNVSATGTSQLVVSGGAIVAAPGSDVLAYYSNHGSAVDVSAPGGDCGPGYPASCVGQYLIANTGISPTGAATYLLYAGTSMATPHVAAVAAQVRSMHPDWTPGAVRSWLKDTAQPIGSRQSFGAGLVDANAATQ